MSHREALTELRGKLASLYNDEASSRRVSVDAGLDTKRINFNATPVNVWQAILEEADKTGNVDNLLGVVFKDYGENKKFRDAYVVWRNTQQDLYRDSNLYRHPKCIQCWIIAGILSLLLVSGLVGLWWFYNIPFNCSVSVDSLQQQCERLNALDRRLKDKDATLREVEPNNTPQQAENLVQPESIYLGHHNDKSDYYEFEANSSVAITMTLSSRNTEGVLDQGIQLQLYSPVVGTNFRVAEVKSYPYSITYTGGPGPYYIRIYTDEAYLDGALSYQLSISFSNTTSISASTKLSITEPFSESIQSLVLWDSEEFSYVQSPTSE